MGTETALEKGEILGVQRNFFNFPSRVNKLADLLWTQANVYKYWAKADTAMPSYALIIPSDAVICITSKLI